MSAPIKSPMRDRFDALEVGDLFLVSSKDWEIYYKSHPLTMRDWANRVGWKISMIRQNRQHTPQIYKVTRVK